MTYLTIVEAANQFKVTRSRIYRAIEKGSLTAHIEDDIKLVDPQDMIRLFGSSKRKTNSAKQVQTNETIQNEQYTKLLIEQLEQAKEREFFYKQQISDIRKDFEDFKLLIGYKPKQNSNVEGEHKSNSEHQNDHVPATNQTEHLTQCNDIKITQNEMTENKKGFWSRFFKPYD